MENMVQLFFLICLVICVAGQVDRFIWVNSMNQFSLDESQPEETKVYTLRATYDGSDNNMEYGFNTKQAADNSLSQESTYFRINKDSGEVFTKGILDYENANIKQNGVQLQLIARLKTDPTQFRKQVSTVIVRNTNDEKPQFVNGSMIVKIEENREILNSGGLRLIPNIKVVDVDNILESGTNKIDATVNNCKVGSKLIQCDRIFTLRLVGNPTSIDAFYDFYVLTKIDFEQYDEFQVQLVATDGKNNGTISVIVDVTDLQDTPPKWIDLPAKSQTQDGTGTNQMRISILARDQDLSTIGGERPIFYALEPGQTVRGIAVDRVFEIQQNNSIYPATITNKVPIDLEDDVLFKNYATKEVRVNWPLRVQACEITSSNPLVIGSTFNECTEYGTTVILIADINDNGPKFDQDQYVYRIYEDAPNGLILDDPRIIITDNDTDIYANYKSVLVNPSLEFNVSGADRNPAITVLNTSLIDYDSGKILYQLTLRTSDVLNPLLFDLAPITIHILDVNDNFPAFGQPNGYKAIIPENSPEGTNVIRITATDRDSGMMGTAGLKYGLTGSYSSLFKIDELTGQVTVAYCDTPGKNPCLDYDILPRLYPLDVIVSDMQGNPNGKQSTVFLEVQVTDVNDNPPTVGNYRRGIFEDKTQFEPPLIVIGTDIDTPSLRYSIQSQAPGTFWRIDPVRGEISVNKNGQGIKFNDGDTSGSFVVFVSVTDGVNPPAQSRVDINVIDINDNAPVFLPDLYEKPIPETTPGGTSILELSATDTDDPTSDNGKLEYSIISGNIGGRFRVNNLGVLFTSNDAKFDYDIQRAYTMVVTVADKGTPQRSDTATVIINILDVNNRDPYVDPFLQNFEVYDNAFLGFKVGTIKAYDPDADAILRFRFNDPKQASSEEGFQVTPDVYDFRYLFRIDENNGDIYVNGSLDSKKTNIVSYGVVVTDVKAVPNQNGPGQAYIRIKPFNTQPPVFEQFQSPIYIDEEQPIGSVIISLIARDNNGIEQYQIIQQPDDFFAANPNTGAVSVVSRVDFDDARRINGSFFIVRVLDTGEPQLSATTSVSVIFRNINDNFPEFINKQTQNPVNVYSAVIDENSPNGTLVVETFAKDSDRPDANGFNVVRYFMNDSRFDVDSLTGQIFVRLLDNAVLDREQNPRILTQVIARDNPDNNPNNATDNQRQRVATVQVTLRDVNDNTPFFSKSEYYVKIFETISVQTDILQLFSTDADLGDFATSYYTKIPNAGDDYSDFFDVRRDSGKIYVKRGLVRNVGVYKFYVQAQDNKGTGFRTNASVTVDVQPSANSPPVWVIPPVDNMTIYVLEEQYDGMLIYDVSARDEDTGNNGIVDYSFMYNGVQTQETPDFKINRVTGMISANRTYDRETQPRYVLLLKATDRGETPLETTRFLTVVIKDVNDNRPTFTKSTEQFTVQENTDVGYRFGRVTATDPDQAPVILYKIIAGNEDNNFEIDASTGDLILVNRLDREKKSIYYLDVQAYNEKPETDYTVIRYRRAIDRSIITVKISVGDINDLAPVFLDDKYFGCVSTRSALDEHIFTAKARDLDAVGTGIVRYSLVGSGHVRQVGDKVINVFDINKKFGVVTNKVVMGNFAQQTFQVTINARDDEDVTTAESANTTGLIFVTEPSNEVQLVLTQPTSEVRLYKEQIQNILAEANDVDYVCINKIQDHVVNDQGDVTALWTDVFLSGIRHNKVINTYKPLSGVEFLNIIQREKSNRKSDFDLLYIRESKLRSSSNEVELSDNAVLVIMIIIAVLIFLVIVFCLIAFMCIRAMKREKKARLLHKTYATPAPIIVAEPVEPEPIIYDNRAYIQEEPQPQKTFQTEPVHVQYAVVQRRPETQVVTRRMEYVPDEDQEAIVVEVDDDNQRRPEGREYRIVTEVAN